MILKEKEKKLIEQKSFEQVYTKILQKSTKLSKHQQIRIKSWLIKFSNMDGNPLWRKNRQSYLKILIQMLPLGYLFDIYSVMPPNGDLPKIQQYQLNQTLNKIKAKRQSQQQIDQKRTKKQNCTMKQNIAHKLNSTSSLINIKNLADGKTQKKIKIPLNFMIEQSYMRKIQETFDEQSSIFNSSNSIINQQNQSSSIIPLSHQNRFQDRSKNRYSLERVHYIPSKQKPPSIEKKNASQRFSITITQSNKSNTSIQQSQSYKNSTAQRKVHKNKYFNKRQRDHNIYQKKQRISKSKQIKDKVMGRPVLIQKKNINESMNQQNYCIEKLNYFKKNRKVQNLIERTNNKNFEYSLDEVAISCQEGALNFLQSFQSYENVCENLNNIVKKKKNLKIQLDESDINQQIQKNNDMHNNCEQCQQYSQHQFDEDISLQNYLQNRRNEGISKCKQYIRIIANQIASKNDS